MDVHYKFVHLLSPSSFKVKSDGVKLSLDHLCIYSRPVRSHVTNLREGPPGPKPWHAFDVLGAETAMRLQALRHDYQASLRLATSWMSSDYSNRHWHTHLVVCQVRLVRSTLPLTIVWQTGYVNAYCYIVVPGQATCKAVYQLQHILHYGYHVTLATVDGVWTTKACASHEVTFASSPLHSICLSECLTAVGMWWYCLMVSDHFSLSPIFYN